MNISEDLIEKFEEVKKLYDLTEAEIALLTQMAMSVIMLGFSLPLTTKLLRALTSMMEIIADEKKVKK